VAGTIDYMIVTDLFTRPGWLIHSIILNFVTMRSSNLFNRKDLKSFRPSLRNKSTSAESALWNNLKSRNLDGRKFRSQYSIYKYIVDFYCPSKKLIIELDKPQLYEYQVNHPGRDQALQHIDYLCTPATPPSKGGESIIALNFTIIIRLHFLILYVFNFQIPYFDVYSPGV
jgi:very-short-patch-repair endonuclease